VSTALEKVQRRAVQNERTSETSRIVGLPEVYGNAPDLTDRFRLPGGKLSLFPIQSQALWEASMANGLLAPIGVGEGKTLISLLLPRVWEAQRPLLLLPAPMKRTFEREKSKFSEHFAVASNLRVETYGKISVASGAYLLDQYRPDVIIADEVHYLRNRMSTRTKRVLRYFKAHPETKFAGLSGTITTRSLLDYAHLSMLALRHGSPLPLIWQQLIAWSACIDANGRATKYDWAKVKKFYDHYAPNNAPLTQPNLRRAYLRRFVSAPGVVTSRKGSISAALNLQTRRVKIPEIVRHALKQLQKTWVSPDGEEEIEDPMRMARVSRQVAQGFYYRWVWPNGRPNFEWLKARAAWHRECRRILMRNVPGLDSPLLVSNAVARGDIRDRALVEAWEKWQVFKKIKQPPTEAVWLSDYLVRDAVKWAKEQSQPVILWYESIAVGQMLEHLGIANYGADTELPEKAVTLAASIRVHGTGKNLQAWANQLVISPPQAGKTWEQLLGRTHRTGQMSDEVWCHYYAHLPPFQAALKQAKSDAQYIQQTQGVRQKLVYATWVD
jgi:hypothetical protein